METIIFDGHEREVVAGEVIVKFRSETFDSSRYKFIVEPDRRGIALLSTAGEDPAGFLEMLNASDEFVWVAPNDAAWPDNEPDDPFYPRQWGMQKVNAEGAWAQHTGSNDVLVAVLDSGIPLTPDGKIAHRDISRHAVLGPDHIGGEPFPFDRHGHGTHVAGIATASNNRVGIVGMAAFCRLFVTKVFGDDASGSVFAWYQGILSAVAEARNTNKRLVVNYSGSGPVENPIHHDGIAEVGSIDGILVATCGNTGGSVRYPAALSTAYDHVVAVGNSNRNDRLAPNSSRGPETTVVAPGTDILSTLPPDQGEYGEFSGTSMAAPLVSGILALMFSANPDLTAADAVVALKNTSFDLGTPGQDPVFGAGRVDAREALRTIQVPPFQPGQPIPKPQPWPNAPMPPNNVTLWLGGVYDIGSGMGKSLFYASQNRIRVAKQFLSGVRNGIGHPGVWLDYADLDNAVGNTSQATILNAHAALEAEAHNVFCWKAGWLKLRELYRVGFHLHYATLVGTLPDSAGNRAIILDEMNFCREAMLGAVICGPVLTTLEQEIANAGNNTPPSAHVPGLKAIHTSIARSFMGLSAVRRTELPVG